MNEDKDKYKNAMKNLIPSFGEEQVKEVSFFDTLKNKVVGLQNINMYLQSINLIESKVNLNKIGYIPPEGQFDNFNNGMQEGGNAGGYNLRFNFNLLDQILFENSQHPYLKPVYYKELSEQKNIYVYGKFRRKKAIEKYKKKKLQRKNSNFIRYKVRKNLAEKRKRHKGKFIKNKKIDMQKAMKEFLQE